MRLDQAARLKESVEAAALVAGSFVEWIDDDESQHVVTGVVHRDSESGPVASLSGGGFVVLKDADASDFRLVSPAIPEAPAVLVLKGGSSNGNRLSVQTRTEIRILGDIPDASIVIQIPTLPPDDPQSPRCEKACTAPDDGADYGKCPVCGRLVARIFRNGLFRVYPAEGTRN